MITNDDILNMNFYKKEQFTGSYQGMRYLIKKDAVPAGNSPNAASSDAASDSAAVPAAEAVMTDVFCVTIWPGPYNFASTDDSEKTSVTFPFTPEGKDAVVAWLNEQWQNRRSEWRTL